MIKNNGLDHPPATEGMLKKAKTLDIEPLMPNSWLVFGGSKPHVVNLLGQYECDCIGFRIRGICSHIVAVENLESQKEEGDA